MNEFWIWYWWFTATVAPFIDAACWVSGAVLSTYWLHKWDD